MTGPDRPAPDPGSDAGLDDFVRHRDLLFTIAYEITGSVTDAEDVVQESYLRWQEAARTSEIRNPRAYLARIATRQALNRQRGNARRREDYVGPWLPEPLVTVPDVADDAVLADAVSMAMRVVLDSLTPDERAVFVLREVFAFGHDEIAEALGKSSAAVRQIAHRARSGVQARRPSPDGATPRDSSARQVAERFLRAATTGELQDLLDVLAPDVVLTADGGGKVSAGLRPIRTADKVGRFLMGIRAKGFGDEVRIEPALVNGRAGVLGYVGDVLDTVLTWDVADDRITAIYLVRNPDKVRTAERAQSVTR
ncbi:RNA polymerase sigma-70 factor [Nakamurella sp.]|uniref:RNA polymerase sigma-70 factor n=1 Tax=Nakamurella sp. TaxID=1869182 RepID=UPI003B3A8D87